MKNLKTQYIKQAVLGMLLSLITTGCENFLEIDPPRTQVSNEIVFNDDATAISAIRGIYSKMIQGGFTSGDVSSMTGLGGLSADEWINYRNQVDAITFYTNSLTPEIATINSAFWQPMYVYINNANGILEGIEASSISESLKKQLRGEAKFIRAFCYFYLVNLFGDVPIVTTTNFEENRLLSRSSIEEVYAFIINDLKEAEALLSEDYSSSGGERIQPNRWTSKALLARVALYNENYSDAEQYATDIINNTSLFTLLPDLNDVFLANSKEAIWQLQPWEDGRTPEVSFVIQSTPPVFYALQSELLDAFQPDDERRKSWVNSITGDNGIWFFPYKYKDLSGTLSEYSMVFRLAEQYLIRAEARAMQGDLSNAITDIDVIRERANLSLIANTNPGINQDDLLEAILHERRVELFTEWGHRWLDLKRMGRADKVLGPIKGANWQPTDVLYPIPLTELEANPNLIQNPGYSG
ncbi:RagB/SusD family nutrient uptake outer membrane protein [Sinomicrobium sp. M5D2P17]